MTAPVPAPRQTAEGDADALLWCVHVIGPDDLYAAKSFRAAVIYAHALNVAIQERFPAEDVSDDDYIMCWANVETWPWSADGHADDLARQARERAKAAATPTPTEPSHAE